MIHLRWNLKVNCKHTLHDHNLLEVGSDKTDLRNLVRKTSKPVFSNDVCMLIMSKLHRFLINIYNILLLLLKFQQTKMVEWKLSWRFFMIIIDRVDYTVRRILLWMLGIVRYKDTYYEILGSWEVLKVKYVNAFLSLSVSLRNSVNHDLVLYLIAFFP